MERNWAKIRCSQGQKYKLDRSTWTTYDNFKDIYHHSYNEIVLAGVTETLDDFEWQDMKGNIVEETNDFYCKVCNKLKHSNYCIVLDDIWGNININGDGHIGGEKFLTEASFFLNRILVATINTSLSLV